jgi:hypothetical protein
MLSYIFWRKLKEQTRTKVRYFSLFLICIMLMFSSDTFSKTAVQASAEVNSAPNVQVGTSQCSTYISAFGVSVLQNQRFLSNWKKFPSVCPATSPGGVDVLIILTHDVDYYAYMLPLPTYVESSGFSNWTAIVLLDSSRMFSSAPTKYKHEYVWIFRVKRGSFDPKRFPADAKPDYSQVESGSHNGDRAIDDAFDYIANQKEKSRIEPTPSRTPN